MRNIHLIDNQIYITSDEEIKIGDYYLCKLSMKPLKCIGDEYFNNVDEKKIILTDNKDLIADGVHTIDAEFVDWFFDNPNCEYVEVTNEKIMIGWEPDYSYEDIGIYGSKEVYQDFYKIIIPKEELSKDEIDKFFIDMVLNPKEEPKQSYEYVGECKGNNNNGCFLDSCGHDCGCFVRKPKQEFPELGTKEFNDLASVYFGGKPKQKTLEETMNQEGYIESDYDKIWRHGVEFGSKWQSERMYSEAQMLLAFETGRMFQLTGENNFNELIEQLKNK